jgi:hypothetical protein
MVSAIQSGRLQNLARINEAFSVYIVEWQCHADDAKKAQITSTDRSISTYGTIRNICARTMLAAL